MVRALTLNQTQSILIGGLSYGDYEPRGSGRFLPARVVAAVLREEHPWPASAMRSLRLGTRRWAAFQEATAEFGAAPSFRELRVLCDCPT